MKNYYIVFVSDLIQMITNAIHLKYSPIQSLMNYKRGDFAVCSMNTLDRTVIEVANKLLTAMEN